LCSNATFDGDQGVEKAGKPKPDVRMASSAMLDSQLASISKGSPISLTTAEGNQIRGRLGDVNKDSVSIQIPEDASFSTRTLAFDQISNLIPIKKLPGTAGLQKHARIQQSLVAIPIGSKLNLGMQAGSRSAADFSGWHPIRFRCRHLSAQLHEQEYPV